MARKKTIMLKTYVCVSVDVRNRLRVFKAQGNYTTYSEAIDELLNQDQASIGNQV